jgi:hypothetical protein
MAQNGDAFCSLLSFNVDVQPVRLASDIHCKAGGGAARVRNGGAVR